VCLQLLAGLSFLLSRDKGSLGPWGYISVTGSGLGAVLSLLGLLGILTRCGLLLTGLILYNLLVHFEIRVLVIGRPFKSVLQAHKPGFYMI
jgi:hypothetical protein